MKKQKILITGGSGLLGQHLNIELSREFDILTLYNQNPGNCTSFPSKRIDLLSPSEIDLLFEEFRPNIVIHTAAVSNPEKALTVPTSFVYQMNVIFTEKLAQLCDKFGARLIYTSTDLVYAGYRGSYLKEDAKLVPMSLYADTKLMGELKIKSTFSNYLILRTVLLFGHAMGSSLNRFHKMVVDFRDGKPSDLFMDQFRSPLALREAARVMTAFCKIDAAADTVNYTGPQRVSRTELGEMVCDYKGFSKSLINYIKMEDKPGTIPVADVSLDPSKLAGYGIKLSPLEDCVREETNRILGA